MDTLVRITQLAVRQFGLEPASLAVDAPVSDYGIDSLGLIEFLFLLEDEFHVRFPEERSDQPQTLRQLAELVAHLRAESAATAQPSV
jgi:acyl carrier protein